VKVAAFSPLQDQASRQLQTNSRGLKRKGDMLKIQDEPVSSSRPRTKEFLSGIKFQSRILDNCPTSGWWSEKEYYPKFLPVRSRFWMQPFLNFHYE
jgi:hypothetical protein